MKTNKNENSLETNSKYLLYNISNYKTTIDDNATDILFKIVSVIVEYMRFISEKITMKNKLHYKFIFERGVETLIHVFSLIFYYTKNLELTTYHTQKAFYFYVEYIEQISNDNITFLQLSSRDAIIFVYKKTIYEINSDYRKNVSEPSNEEKNILSILESYAYIYKTIVQFIVNHRDFNYDTKIEYINKCCDQIETVVDTLNKIKYKKNVSKCIYSFTNLLLDKQVDVNSFFDTLNNFIKKISIKKKIDEKLLKQKMYDTEINNFIYNNEMHKIIDWIFTD